MEGFAPVTDNCATANSWLVRLDPRLKLLVLLLLVVSVFSARHFATLIPPALLAGLLIAWQPAMVRGLLRRIAYLRWLLIFTLLLHLFLSPGRTLFGLRLLSYDGLLRGLFVDAQLMLAMFFTLVFALTTPPAAVAWGASRLLRPLERLGLTIADAGGLLSLVLHFLPQVFAQGEPLLKRARRVQMQGLQGRLQRIAQLTGDLVLELVEQADRLAAEMAAGQSPLPEAEVDFRWKWADSLCLCGVVILVGVARGL